MSRPEFRVQLLEIAKSNAVFFLHALNSPKQKIANFLPDACVKVWFVWGYDLYGAWKPFRRRLYEPLTLKFLQHSGKDFSIKERFQTGKFAHALLRWSGSGLPFPAAFKNRLEAYFGTDYWRAINKIDLVVPIIPHELRLVRAMGIAPQAASFTYGFLENLLIPGLESVSGENILIGNSADPSNNHLDAFEHLSKLDLGNKKIIVPLSYGGNDKYKQAVVIEGKRRFGENFMPLTDFIPLADYVGLLSSCGIVVFNHTRQQGVGNLVVMGYLGAQIFLNDKSPVLEYYKEEKAVVFAVSALDQKTLGNPLQPAEKAYNKSVFERLYKRETVFGRTLELLEIVSEIRQAKESAAKSSSQS